MPQIVLDRAPFTLQGLPYGVISTPNEPQSRCAVAIGNHVLDLAKYANKGGLSGVSKDFEHVDFDRVFGQV